MNQNVVSFRSKSEREAEVKLIHQYREIGIAAIAAANTAFRGKKDAKTSEPRRNVISGYAD